MLLYHTGQVDEPLLFLRLIRQYILLIRQCFNYARLYEASRAAMPNLILADLIVFCHFIFILFVIFGGFLVVKWRKLIWLHIPAAIWGVLIEFVGWLCPLTHWENYLRRSSGGYSSGFIEHYIIPLIYPSGLTREIQIDLGLIVVLLNFMVYRKLHLERQDNVKHNL